MVDTTNRILRCAVKDGEEEIEEDIKMFEIVEKIHSISEFHKTIHRKLLNLINLVLILAILWPPICYLLFEGVGR